MLDIGTGSGVLAVAAARAGARRVYAVEASDIAEVAERVFAANEVQDRVTLVPGGRGRSSSPSRPICWSPRSSATSRFEEEILETTLDARRRLLKPGARLIPNALTLLARPLLLPEAEARQRALGRAAVERWRGLYGIDFEPLLDAAIPGPRQHPDRGRSGRHVAAGRPAGRARRRGPHRIRRRRRFALTPTSPSTQPGAVNAVAVTFRADLHGDIAHTLDPWTWPTSSWATSVWVLPDPLCVGPRGGLARPLPPPSRRERRTGSPARSSTAM